MPAVLLCIVVKDVTIVYFVGKRSMQVSIEILCFNLLCFISLKKTRCLLLMCASTKNVFMLFIYTSDVGYIT
jgi:hypothetical protein